MRCPKCRSEEISVVDSRGDGDSIRRRRECQGCTYRFTTFERIEMPLPMVIKKDGRREAFDREKIRGGIIRACEKRPVSMEAIDQTVERLEQQVSERCVKEIPSISIGDFVMAELRHLDKIAYVRFASVYREFSDVNQFVDTLETLTGRSGKKTSAAGRVEPQKH